MQIRQKVHIVPDIMNSLHMSIKINVLRETVIPTQLTYKANVIDIVLPAPVVVSQLCESINDDTHEHIEKNHNDKYKENHIIEESQNEKSRVCLE